MVLCKTTPTSAVLVPELAWASQQAGKQMLLLQLHPSRAGGAAGDLGLGPAGFFVLVVQVWAACSCCSEPEKLCFVSACMQLMLAELLDTFNPIHATSVSFSFAFLAQNKFGVLCEANSSESKVWSWARAKSVAQPMLLQFMVL